MSRGRPRVVLAMPEVARERMFPAARLAELDEVAEVVGELGEFSSARARRILADTEVLVTGWGSPFVGADILDLAPRLRAVLHSAGSIRAYVDPAILHRGVAVSSMAAANAVPVAEYTVAMIVLAGKRILPMAADYRRDPRAFDIEAAYPDLGNHGKQVGIVGASKIGRLVIALLRAYDLDVVVHDPYLDELDAEDLGVRTVGLDELLETSDVVSVHAPSLPSTLGLIDARGIGRMRRGATLINTARGEIVDQDALTARILAGDLYAVLDVTTPEVLPAGHPLLGSDRVLITPHAAGSLGSELGRLAASVCEELRQLARDEPLAHGIEPERLEITA
ncbi:hydroxyacid dehydrogenase [Microbacterium sp. Au-Mic1]|uniref:hydroxyacid dehydrogenase n=1 Tax=Microbacterium sp. Au-Mic1 TaxID=2906457 RepID=UPI001E4B7DE8|nr:hydroxyacid dehydrogenase [Microbacterium sp. Au-Mic1]MCE4026240.1 hydroxyacid dehydrogenase [Microbacterium sp. Au-Mic1]